MPLNDKTVYFLGKLAATSRKTATGIVRRCGGKVAKKLSASVGIVVVGEGDVLGRDWNLWNDQLDDATRQAFEAGTLEIVDETSFWSRCGEQGLTVAERGERSTTTYTMSMLAELTGVPRTVLRRLQRRGLIVPVRQIHRLGYFDFKTLAPLKIVRTMLDAGLSVAQAVDRLEKVRRHLDGGPVDVHVQGGDVLLLTRRGPVDQDGQRRFDFTFDSVEPDPEHREPETLEVLDAVFEPGTEPRDAACLCEAAWTLESEGRFRDAVDLFRAALAAGGPNPLINFQIAELLYRLGEPAAARERYFMAVELDEEFVEARANLGCVLAELGQDELAAAAFRGALRYHPDYAEVHFHLGMLLRRVGLPEDADRHLQLFLELAPDSPWAERLSERDTL